MTDKVENSGESPGAAESEDSYVFVKGNQTEETQNLDQPVESTLQLPAAIKDESHSTSGPNTVKDEAMAHGMSKDDVTEGTAISQDTGMESSEFDFSKWKLERIGENLCLIFDTEKMQLPKFFRGKSNPKLYKHENKILIVGTGGQALEVRKDEKEKLIFIETETPVSDTDKSKLLDRLDKSTDNDPEKLEKHIFSDCGAISLENGNQQSVQNFENNPEGERNLSTSDSHLKEQFNDETKTLLSTKVDDIVTSIDELRKQKIDERYSEGINSYSIASMQENTLKDDGEQPLGDSQLKRKINEYTVSPFLELILEYEKQQEDKQHLFSGIEISFKEKGKDMICTINRESDIPDSVVDKIRNLHEGYGKRDVAFSEIKYLKNVIDEEGMLKTLLTGMRTNQVFLWKINSSCKKILIVSSHQPTADKLSSEIKGGLDFLNFILTGTMKNENFAKQLQAEINTTYGCEIQMDFNPDVWSVNLVGLRKSVAAASEDLQIISKSVYVDSTDKLLFIEGELKKGIVASDTKFVQIERKENKGKIGFVLHGMSKQVSLLCQKIDEIQNDFVVSDVGIKDYTCLTFLSSSAGDEFMNILASQQNVNINRNWSNEMISKDMFPPMTHTLPTGHQIVLTSLASNGTKVNFVVSGYSAEPSFIDKENRFDVYIPKYSDGKEKEKEKIEMAMKQLLKLIEENGLFQVSLCIEEVGCWRPTKLMKNVLYCLKNHMSSYLKIPSTVFLVPMEDYKEAQKAFSYAFPDLEFDDSHYRDDDGSLTEMSVDAWKSDLLEIQADALVYAVHPSLDLKKGNISSTLAARAGQELQDELKSKYKKGKLKPWEFACTKGYKLPYKNVLHGALDEYKHLDSVKDIQNFIFRCLEKAEELKLSSIVFPALGTGRCGYTTKDIATAIYEASMAFQMKFPMSSMKKVIISSQDASAHDEISKQLQTKKEPKLLKIGKVLTSTRLVSQDAIAVMADSLVVFWEMKSFSTVRVQDSSFLVRAGSKVSKAFTKGRDTKSGRTFVTEGGYFYPKKIIHVPYHDDENKLEAAFEDGLDKADVKSCNSCLLYFTKTCPMFKYRDRMMFHILRAIKKLSQRLVNIKSIVILFESENETILSWFEESAKKLDLMGPRQDESATTQITPALNQTITITGLKENVGRAKQELENKITQLQKPNVIKESAKVAPPGEMDISRTDRGLPDDQLHQVSSSGDEASKYPTKTDDRQGGVDMKPMKMYEASKTRENMQGVSATKDKELDVLREPDSQQW